MRRTGERRRLRFLGCGEAARPREKKGDPSQGKTILEKKSRLPFNFQIDSKNDFSARKWQAPRFFFPLFLDKHYPFFIQQEWNFSLQFRNQIPHFKSYQRRKIAEALQFTALFPGCLPRCVRRNCPLPLLFFSFGFFAASAIITAAEEE